MRAGRVSVVSTKRLPLDASARDEIAQHACAGRESSRTCAARGIHRAGTWPGCRRRRAPCRGRRALRRRRRAPRRAGARRARARRRERETAAQRLQEPLRRRRDPLDVNVLRLAPPDQIAQPQQQRGPACAAAAEHDRNARAGPPADRRARRAHDARARDARESSSARSSACVGKHRHVNAAARAPSRSPRRIPRRRGARRRCPGSQVSTRCSFSSASRVPSATTTMPACSE